MRNKKRTTKIKIEKASIPEGAALKRLEALCALGKAHMRAKAIGVVGTGKGPRTQHDHKPRQDDALDAMHKRVNFLIELETRWRLRQLGIPYTEDMRTRFSPFDMASRHRMQIEAAHNREEQDRLRRDRERKRAEDLTAKQAAKANGESATGE